MITIENTQSINNNHFVFQNEFVMLLFKSMLEI